MPWGLINIAVCFVAFGALAAMSPCNPSQRRFVSRELPDDALYWLTGLVIYGDLATFYIKAGAGLLFQARGAAVAAAVLGGYGWAARLPLPVQAAAVIVAMDFVQYWLHRLFHGHALWPFHAVHHSPVELDWTATYRIHPVNFVVYSAGALALVRIVGFSPAAYAIIGPFNLVIGSLVHANLDWTFGPFRYVLASPVYHRWHHVRDPAIYNRNFAPTFPVWDLMFGTYYMPKGLLPHDYGVDGMPSHFVGQMIYPFQVIGERIAAGRKTRAGEAAA
jgi:sterol desaturase/sphingolipid hydroxylase (fatty acid hydroxylase superfamily)